MAEERAESGNGLRHDAQVRFVAQRSREDGLAEAQPIGAEFAFDLQAMQAQRNFKIREEICAEEQAVMMGDIHQLDRKYVRGTMEFIKREEQRRRIALTHPPFRGVRGGARDLRQPARSTMHRMLRSECPARNSPVMAEP